MKSELRLLFGRASLRCGLLPEQLSSRPPPLPPCEVVLYVGVSVNSVERQVKMWCCP